MMRSTLSLQQI